MSSAAASSPPGSAAANSIGFLRLALAGLVVYSHAYYIGGFGEEPLSRLTGGSVFAGGLAVQAFFVLSGRLIAESWIKRPDLGRFLAHRALRLFPAFWVCLAIVACVLTPLLHLVRPAPDFAWSDLLREAPAYVWRNLFLPRTQIAIGPYPPGGDWNGSLWTLFYEGAAYLAVAGLGLASFLARRRRLGLGLLLAVLVLHTAWRIAPGLIPGPLPRLFDTPGKQLGCFFAAGVLCALAPGLETWLARKKTGLLFGGLFVVSVLLGWHPAAGPWLLPPVLFALAAALPLRGFERAVGGDYSYGVYLYGYPVQQTLACLGAPALGLPLWCAAGLLGALALAIPSWHLVEKTALALKHRPLKVPPARP